VPRACERVRGRIVLFLRRGRTFGSRIPTTRASFRRRHVRVPDVALHRTSRRSVGTGGQGGGRGVSSRGRRGGEKRVVPGVRQGGDG